MNFLHQPVLLDEVVRLLNLDSGKIVVDGTIGLAGHSKEILRHIQPGGRLIGIDLDPATLNLAKENLKTAAGPIDLFCDNFTNLGPILQQMNIKGVDAIILDLGISSYQLAENKRGFSFQSAGPLDMRMNPSSRIRAGDIVNRAGFAELAKIFKEYGEERFSRRIARGIIKARQKRKITTTVELAGIIEEIVPYKHSRIHPATRIFQSLRIAVNDELNNLARFLKSLEQYLNSKGRLAIISFHSLEDRIVKRAFVAKKNHGVFRIITKKPVIPGDEEARNNPRARSAKLRIAEKI